MFWYFVHNNTLSFFKLIVMQPPLSIDGNFIKFGSCTMESDKFITVCENKDGVAKWQLSICRMEILVLDNLFLLKLQ